jgi:hypothetical protein
MVATGLGPDDSVSAPVVPPPSFFVPHVPPPHAAAPDPAPIEQPIDREEQFVRRRPFARARWLVPCAAGLAFAGIVAALVVLWHGRQPSANRVATPAQTAPIALASVAPPSATTVAPPAPAPVEPVAKAARTPPAVAQTIAPGIAEPVRSASPHAASPDLPHFSRAAAQRAISSVTGKVRRCRHRRYWGNGYATVVFTNDGSVDRVLIDPPFSMTVTGKCVADALSHAHMRSFGGRKGYYRLRFYIAPRS